MYVYMYDNYFAGEEGIDWMMNNLPLHSRLEAQLIGQKLIDTGYVTLANSKQYLYRVITTMIVYIYISIVSNSCSNL